MTERNWKELKAGLRKILNQLLPSWQVSDVLRSLIKKILMILLLIGKVSHIVPAFADSEVAKPHAIVLNSGPDNVVSVSQLWAALSPEQRAILVALELEVPDLAESLVDETPETLNAFFADARAKLSALPLWQQVQQLASDPNFPSTIPASTKEMRSFVDSNGQLTIVIAEHEGYARAISRTAWQYLEAAPAYFVSTNTYKITNQNKIQLVDGLIDPLLNEVFRDDSGSS